MTKAIYIENQKYYTYHEGLLTFQYWPDTRRVDLVHNASFLRGIEYFVEKGFKINWSASDPYINKLIVELPEDLKPFEKDIMAGIRGETRVSSKIEKSKERKETLKKNIDNTTGEQLNLKSLDSSIQQFPKSTKSKQKICDWFNQFNLEDARREDYPVMAPSTKSKVAIVEEGKKAFDELKNKGELRRLTEEELSNKLIKVNIKEESDSGE